MSIERKKFIEALKVVAESREFEKFLCCILRKERFDFSEQVFLGLGVQKLKAEINEYAKTIIKGE